MSVGIPFLLDCLSFCLSSAPFFSDCLGLPSVICCAGVTVLQLIQRDFNLLAVDDNGVGFGLLGIAIFRLTIFSSGFILIGSFGKRAFPAILGLRLRIV